VTPFVADAGDQLHPAISPDGKTLAYVSPVSGKLGTGGIWTRPIDGVAPGAPTLVHYEESEYRMRPKWTPDGKALLFGSDEMGSNDIAIILRRRQQSCSQTTRWAGSRGAVAGRRVVRVRPNRAGPMA
jgi:Tol biopolymer transport system component